MIFKNRFSHGAVFLCELIGKKYLFTGIALTFSLFHKMSRI